MDLLFVELIERFRSEGRATMSLGLAPLSGLTGDGPAERALRLIYERGGRAFNFAGLRSFKAKWHPRWEPRYLGYRREADLPRVALAVARAGELQVPKPFHRAVSSISRLRGSAALLGVIWALMIVTGVQPALHAVLLHRFGLRYEDLLRGQLWRLISAPLLQPRPGILWSNVAMLIAVPVAEIRLGWRRTLAVCFLAETTSTLITMAALRIAPVTSAPAAAALNVADTGSSSLAWGAVVACAASLATPRLRVIVAGVLTLPLVGALVLHHGSDDAQHLLAAAVGAGLILATGSRATTNRPLAWLRRHERRPRGRIRRPRKKSRTEARSKPTSSPPPTWSSPTATPTAAAPAARFLVSPRRWRARLARRLPTIWRGDLRCLTRCR